MVFLASILSLLCPFGWIAVSAEFSYNTINATCTISNLTNDSKVGNYSFLSNTTEQLILKNASFAELNVTVPLSVIVPWKFEISDSNVTRVIFPGRMSPSLINVRHVPVETVLFEENGKVQDFRAEYTSLAVVPPSVTKLVALDILWITHSQLTNFSFDMLANSTVSLLYMVSNRIETISITPGSVCCRKLEEIFFSNNRLKQLDFGMMARMARLKAIFMEDNQLVGMNTTIQGDDGDMQSPATSGNGTVRFCPGRVATNVNVTVPLPNCTNYFATLLSIYLARNQLSEVDFGTFRLMKSLNSLDLSNNRMEELVASAGQTPPALSELYVSNNRISTVAISAFAGLKALYLYDNNVKELNLTSIPKTVDYLSLLNNPINCDELPDRNRTAGMPPVGPLIEC